MLASWIRSRAHQLSTKGDTSWEAKARSRRWDVVTLRILQEVRDEPTHLGKPHKEWANLGEPRRVSTELVASVTQLKTWNEARPQNERTRAVQFSNIILMGDASWHFAIQLNLDSDSNKLNSQCYYAWMPKLLDAFSNASRNERRYLGDTPRGSHDMVTPYHVRHFES